MTKTTSEHLLALAFAHNQRLILRDGACQPEHVAHSRVRLVHKPLRKLQRTLFHQLLSRFARDAETHRTSGIDGSLN